jgi:hypothetical protein
MASSSSSGSATVDSKMDSSSSPPSSLPFTLEDIQRIIDSQTAVFSEKFACILTEMSTIKTSVQDLSCDVADLKQRTLAMEASCEEVKEKQDDLQSTVEDLEEDVVELKKKVNEELDKIEAISRRDNVRFFNLPESPDENYESCVDKVVNVLQSTVPDKKWSLDDVVRAHRLGPRTSKSVSNPRPMIVKMARWKDKLAILSSGRDALKKKGIKVAGDLTTRQRAVLKEHREKGMYAFYRAGKLIVAGPLRTRENWSGPWQHHDEARRKQDANRPTEVVGDGVSSALLNPSEWPAVRSSRLSRPANPSKRPRLPSSPDIQPLESDHTTKERM